MTGHPPTLTVVSLIGNPRPGSRTRSLAAALTSAVLGHVTPAHGVAPTERVLELGELVGVSFGPEPAYGATAAGDDPLELVRTADLLVVATPTYKATYTGLLKIFLDRYAHGDLAGATAVPVALAASEEHRRSVSSSLRDLLVELGASVPAPALAALESELAEQGAEGLAGAWADRYAGVITDGLAVTLARAVR